MLRVERERLNELPRTFEVTSSIATDARWLPRSQNTVECVFMALRTFFGYTVPTGLERMEDEIVAEARRLWRVRYAHGQYRFMPRAELEQILRSDLRRILHRWRVVIGPARWRLYYGPFDLAGALTMVRSRVSKAALRRINCIKKLGSYRVD